MGMLKGGEGSEGPVLDGERASTGGDAAAVQLSEALDDSISTMDDEEDL
jgi:hypothetical protein